MWFSYRKRCPVLSGVSLDVGDATITALLGSNGSGKSTLIKCIARILRKGSGTISVDGASINEMRQRQLAKLVAYVPQRGESPFAQRVFDVVLLGRTPYNSFRATKSDRRKVAEILGRLQLEELAFEMYDELSGGQRQRVLLARALVQEPRVLLLDEPTTFLDLRNQLEALLVIRKLVVEREMCALLAIHDVNLAARFADEVTVLDGGEVAAQGSNETVLDESLIRKIYGVESVIGAGGGYRMVIPVAPVDRRDEANGLDAEPSKSARA